MAVSISREAASTPPRRLAPVISRYIIPTTMEARDSAAEWLYLSERYRQMSDSEILVLRRQDAELTDVARQILASEISRRGLKLQSEELPVAPRPGPQPDSSYDEDRKLVEICTVWSLPD